MVAQFPAPAVPQFPDERAAFTEHIMRYEDLTQDGCLMPLAIPSTMSGLWRTILVKHPGARNAASSGVIPLLTRLTITSLEHPIRLTKPLEVRSGFELARGDDRLHMNVWCGLRGLSMTEDATQIGKAPSALVDCGAIFAEHTFTRPFAPPGQRKVTELAVEGYPRIPEARYAAPSAASAGELPDGAHWVDVLAPDRVEACFTLDQTDSNQHVNSLVYIRVFLDAAARRIPQLRVRSRSIDIAYRKPSFAGDRLRVHLRLFEVDGEIGAAGFLAADDDKPRCYIRVRFTRRACTRP